MYYRKTLWTFEARFDMNGKRRGTGQHNLET